ncbi:MAG: energy transducer TonB [Pseudoflavonifractor sp.]|nr:energy transducer TonB [Alloprevotella sp.]MCM1116793.1 energy transducer TonB [Pseudoflavonifractor sp.]
MAKLIITLLSLAALTAAAHDGPQGRRTVALAYEGGTSTTAYLYEAVDIHPVFPGGDRKMMSFINAERRYPADAYRRGVEGRVICSFLVHPDGSISHIEVVRGVEESLDREAIRIIGAMPHWEPGYVGSKAVATFCILPIPFRR